MYHAATWDYEDIGPRRGHRAVGLGEKPYLDPQSPSRRQALAQEEVEREKQVGIVEDLQVVSDKLQ